MSYESFSKQFTGVIIAIEHVGIPVNEKKNYTFQCFIKNHFKQIVYISALSGDGLEALEQAVASLLKTNELDPSSGILFTERQRDAARRARDCVQEALDAQRSGVTLDAVTVSVEGAVSALLELTGERATEAVVDQVFAQFCVGK